MSGSHKSLNIIDMDSSTADAATGAHTYFLFRDAHGTAHMVDHASEVPANAKQVQKITIPAKDAPPPGTVSRLQQATVGSMTSWAPQFVTTQLARVHLTWNTAGGLLLFLFFFVRFQGFRSLMFKVALPLVLLGVSIGGYMSYRHRHGGVSLAQGLSQARQDADSMRRGLRRQDRIMQQVEADAGQPGK